jgi:lipopolysaccharide transport system permease protein
LALSLGASLFLCGLVVFLSDLNYVWGLFCRLLFFITPVFYSLQIVGEGIARSVLELNPLTGLIMLAREALLYGGSIDPARVALALVGPLFVLILGVLLFNAVKPKIPDFI